MTGTKVIGFSLAWFVVYGLASAFGQDTSVVLPKEMPQITVSPDGLSLPVIAAMLMLWLKDWVKHGVPVRVTHTYGDCPHRRGPPDDETSGMYKIVPVEPKGNPSER